MTKATPTVEALRQIASCKSNHPGDVVDIAEAALPTAEREAEILWVLGLYLQEFDNPVPDHLLRANLRTQLRALMDKPAAKASTGGAE